LFGTRPSSSKMKVSGSISSLTTGMAGSPGIVAKALLRRAHQLHVLD
jgi:hypothetical protein